MPLIYNKKVLTTGDVVVALQMCYPSVSGKRRLERYGMDFTDTTFLDVRVGRVSSMGLRGYIMVRNLGRLYYNPKFYAGLGFTSCDRRGFGNLYRREEIMGVICGYLDGDDAYGVEALLKEIIKRYRPSLLSRFSEGIQGEPKGS